MTTSRNPYTEKGKNLDPGLLLITQFCAAETLKNVYANRSQKNKKKKEQNESK